MVHWDREPGFYSAMASVYALIGLAGLGFAVIGLWQLIFWRQRIAKMRSGH